MAGSVPRSPTGPGPRKPGPSTRIARLYPARRDCRCSARQCVGSAFSPTAGCSSLRMPEFCARSQAMPQLGSGFGSTSPTRTALSSRNAAPRKCAGDAKAAETRDALAMYAYGAPGAGATSRWPQEPGQPPKSWQPPAGRASTARTSPSTALYASFAARSAPVAISCRRQRPAASEASCTVGTSKRSSATRGGTWTTQRVARSGQSGQPAISLVWFSYRRTVVLER